MPLLLLLSNTTAALTAHHGDDDMKISLVKGTTSKLILLQIVTPVGTDVTGLVYNTAGLKACYYREGAVAPVTIALISATPGTWVSGGFVAVDGTNLPGLYQLGLPDAALATGVASVAVRITGTNLWCQPVEIELTGVNSQDAAAFGMTSLNATVGSRSTYAGTDTPGTTTLLTRIPAAVPPRTAQQKQFDVP